MIMLWSPSGLQTGLVIHDIELRRERSCAPGATHPKCTVLQAPGLYSKCQSATSLVLGIDLTQSAVVRTCGDCDAATIDSQRAELDNTCHVLHSRAHVQVCHTSYPASSCSDLKTNLLWSYRVHFDTQNLVPA